MKYLHSPAYEDGTGVWVLISDVSELNVGSIFIGRWMKSPAYEDGTDSEFRNVGN